MKVGLDGGPLSDLLKLDPLQLLDQAVEYGFEGVALSGKGLLEDEAYRQQVIEKAQEYNLYIELGGAGIDTALSGKSKEELLDEWKSLFPIAVEVGSRILSTGVGTWPWKGRLFKEKGRTLSDQIQGAIEMLCELRRMAQDYGVTVTIHTSFLTASEYLHIMEKVDSRYVGLCLDTANSFLVLEDPVDFARQLLPYVRATHFKDSCVYLQEEGMDWLGGCPLGRGLVDLPYIVGMLYEANPEVNLSIEDHWGRMTVPLFNEEFLESFPEWTGQRLAKLFQHLWRGESLIRAGLHPTAEEAKGIDWKKVFPERQRSNAAYAKRLRDETVARYQSSSGADENGRMGFHGNT